MTIYHDVWIVGVKWMDKEVVATLPTVDDYSIVEFQRHKVHRLHKCSVIEL